MNSHSMHGTLDLPSWPPHGRYAEGLPAESPERGERGRPPLLPSLDARGRVAKIEDTAGPKTF